MGCSCPKVSCKSMNPNIGGVTRFNCSSKNCYPLDGIEINPTHVELYKRQIGYELDKTNLPKKIQDYMKQVLVSDYVNYIKAHETSHFKGLINHPDLIPYLIRRYGAAWRPIIEGADDFKTTKDGKWNIHSPYLGEQKLAKLVAETDPKLKEYLYEPFNPVSCLTN